MQIQQLWAFHVLFFKSLQMFCTSFHFSLYRLFSLLVSHSGHNLFFYTVFLVVWPRRVWCHYYKLTCKGFCSASKLNKNNIRPQVISSASKIRCFDLALIFSLLYFSKTACDSVPMCDVISVPTVFWWESNGVCVVLGMCALTFYANWNCLHSIEINTRCRQFWQIAFFAIKKINFFVCYSFVTACFSILFLLASTLSHNALNICNVCRRWTCKHFFSALI